MNEIDTSQGKLRFERKPLRTAKRIKIRVDGRRKITVFAEPSVKKSEIESTLGKKAKWIFEKLQLVEEHKQMVPKHEFVSGESFFLKGRLYRLKIIKAKEERVGTDTSRIFCSTPNRKSVLVKKMLVKWYQKVALEYISNRVARLQVKFKRKPTRVFVRNQMARWGSCSMSGQLRFNWRLIMAPPSVIDYVIVHELVHLQEKNHTKRYWEMLKGAMPNYVEKKEWLRLNGCQLKL